MKITFNNSKGNRLVGILENPSNDSNAPVVLMTAGFTSDKDSHSFPPLVKKLHQNNIATFRIDIYSHGESEGAFENITVTQATDDILQAIRYLKDQGYSQIGLLGISFGSIASILATAESSDVSFLVLLSGVVDLMKNSSLQNKKRLAQWKKDGFVIYKSGDFESRLNYSFVEDAQKNNGYKVVDKITVPTFIVHGDEDETVPFEESKKFVKLLSNGRLHTIKGGKHMLRKNQGHFKEYTQVICDFIIEQAK